MKNSTLIHAILILLISLTLFTLVFLTLNGKNGIINQEKEEYNKTHVEEIQENKQNNGVTIKK